MSRDTASIPLTGSSLLGSLPNTTTPTNSSEMAAKVGKYKRTYTSGSGSRTRVIQMPKQLEFYTGKLQMKYDPMTGARTAAILGSLLAVVLVYIIYKAKCKRTTWTQHDEMYFTIYKRKMEERDKQARHKRMMLRPARKDSLYRPDPIKVEATAKWIQTQPLYSAIPSQSEMCFENGSICHMGNPNLTSHHQRICPGCGFGQSPHTSDSASEVELLTNLQNASNLCPCHNYFLPIKLKSQNSSCDLTKLNPVSEIESYVKSRSNSMPNWVTDRPGLENVGSFSHLAQIQKNAIQLDSEDVFVHVTDKDYKNYRDSYQFPLLKPNVRRVDAMDENPLSIDNESQTVIGILNNLQSATSIGDTGRQKNITARDSDIVLNLANLSPISKERIVPKEDIPLNNMSGNSAFDKYGKYIEWSDPEEESDTGKFNEVLVTQL